MNDEQNFTTLNQDTTQKSVEKVLDSFSPHKRFFDE